MNWVSSFFDSVASALRGAARARRSSNLHKCVTTDTGDCMNVFAHHDDRAEAAALLEHVHETILVLLAVLRERYLGEEQEARARAYAEEAEDDGTQWLCAEMRLRHALVNIARPLDWPRLVAAALAPVSPRAAAELRARVATLLRRWDPDELYEHDQGAFTYSHGARMIYCLRAPDGTLLPPHLMEFVALHELAHVITPGFEHPPEYWENFKWLLHEAHQAGLHAPRNYRRAPTNYCGIAVTDSPYYDPHVRALWH